MFWRQIGSAPPNSKIALRTKSGVTIDETNAPHNTEFTLRTESNIIFDKIYAMHWNDDGTGTIVIGSPECYRKFTDTEISWNFVSRVMDEARITNDDPVKTMEINPIPPTTTNNVGGWMPIGSAPKQEGLEYKLPITCLCKKNYPEALERAMVLEGHVIWHDKLSRWVISGQIDEPINPVHWLHYPVEYEYIQEKLLYSYEFDILNYELAGDSESAIKFAYQLEKLFELFPFLLSKTISRRGSSVPQGTAEWLERKNHNCVPSHLEPPSN